MGAACCSDEHDYAKDIVVKPGSQTAPGLEEVVKPGDERGPGVLRKPPAVEEVVKPADLRGSGVLRKPPAAIEVDGDNDANARSTAHFGSSSVFFQEQYPGLAAENVSGHRPQVMFSGHVKPGVSPADVVENLKSRGYRALLNIQEEWEPEYMDLDSASTDKGLVYIHIPVPSIEEAEEGQMHEDKLTLDLARQLGILQMVLPRPLMIMSTTAKRASAVWFFNYVVKMNLSSAQVMMLTASAGLGFATSPHLLFWVGRFMMMVDAERARNRMVFGDLKFDGANEVDMWDPDLVVSRKTDPTSAKESPVIKPYVDPLLATLVTGPDGKLQTHGDTLTGWRLPAPCPFTDVVFPGFIDSDLGGLGRCDSGPQCTFGRFRLGGSAQYHAAEWLVTRQYRSVLNLGHSEDVDFVDFGEDAREVGLEYMHIPVEDPDLKAEAYSLNLARIIALSILGMPRPIMIASGGMRRASVAWTLAHATRWNLGSVDVQKLALSGELNFTLSPKLCSWVDEFMKVADAAIKRGEKVLGDIEITGQNVSQWHLDLSKKAKKKSASNFASNTSDE